MRSLLASLSLLAAACALGCSHAVPSAAPAAPLAEQTLAAPAASAAPVSTITVTRKLVPVSATVISATGAGTDQLPVPGPAGFDLSQALSNPQYAAANATGLAQASSAEDAILTAQDTQSNPPSFRIDDRTPYGIVVAARSAHTATIAWRTDIATTGVITYTKYSLFGKAGATQTYTDTVAKTDHEIAVTGLSRWTKYSYTITAIDPLGLKFSDNRSRTFRTKFWSLN